MSLCKEKIESTSRDHKHGRTHVRAWRKNQLNRFIRRMPITDDDIGVKIGRKPIVGWQY